MSYWRTIEDFLKKSETENSELIWLDQILEFPHVTKTESIWLDQIVEFLENVGNFGVKS